MARLKFLSALPVLGSRPKMAQPKSAMPTRLDKSEKDKSEDERKLRIWRAAIWKRDKGLDRYTGRPVKKTLALDPDRGECNHIEPRGNYDVRYDPRNGILVSLRTHERITKNELKIVGTKFFTVKGKKYINAKAPVKWVAT